jgi:hypothetical protein
MSSREGGHIYARRPPGDTLTDRLLSVEPDLSYAHHQPLFDMYLETGATQSLGLGDLPLGVTLYEIFAIGLRRYCLKKG